MSAMVRFFGILAGLFLTLSPLCAQTAPTRSDLERLSFSSVVKDASPAVVNIYTRRVVRTQSPLFSDPIFRQFFGAPFGVPQERVQRSLGSGVIVRGDGIVVTNFHVIRNSDEITVVLSDRREYEAKLLGADERSDLAVLKLDISDQKLPILPMGDSDEVEVGDVVLAIGNPFGVGQTVTMGIVSALARTAVGVADYRSFIQTDAAINPGNSGGALIDGRGRLIGVNTAIYSANGGGSVGIGFAIPTSLVKAVVKGITEGGKVVRPWLGATGQGVSAEMFQELGLSHPVGVLINQVREKSPAERAGLKAGDVVMAVNGREVEDAEALRFRIATLTIGERAALTVNRRGGEQKITIDLEAPPETPPRDAMTIEGNSPLSGATVANINPALIEEYGMHTAESGVAILGVSQNGYARRLQLQPGDVVLKVNEQPAPDVATLRAILERPAKRWTISLRRGAETISLSIGR